MRQTYFAGAGRCGAGFTGAGVVCCVFGFTFPKTLPDVVPRVRVAMIASDMEVTMNNAAAIVVAFESTVAEPRGPKAVCEPMPPKAPARSAALPLCSNTTITRKKLTRTCTIVSAITIFLAF